MAQREAGLVTALYERVRRSVSIAGRGISGVRIEAVLRRSGLERRDRQETLRVRVRPHDAHANVAVERPERAAVMFVPEQQIRGTRRLVLIVDAAVDVVSRRG